MWKKLFDHQVLRERGMRPTKGRRIPVFKVRHQGGGASKEKGRKTAAVREWKDMTLVARQLHHVVMKFTGKDRRYMLLQIGPFYPCQCATRRDMMVFVEAIYPDAAQEGPFCDSEGHVVDYPTE